MNREEIIQLIKREVVPAVGCTEPAAVALCVAYCVEALGTRPESIEVLLSANMLKNAMGVGVPGTGMTGLPVAIALGAVCGHSSDGLEVLGAVSPDDVAEARAMMESGIISIKLKEPAPDKLYIEVRCSASGRNAVAVIGREHTLLVYLQTPDGKVRTDRRSELGETEDAAGAELTLKEVYDFAVNTPISELEFIKEAKTLNEAASKASLKGNYGHELGKTLIQPLGRGIMGDTIFSHILSATSGACDARMAGAMIPVMSNSGSGNQGIAATMPVVVYAEENNNTEEELVRALVLSHLTAIYIKQSLGRLSALCGCVVASTGSACGITYLMGGQYPQIAYSVKNMIANLAGMVCDGAKPSCALKLSSGVSTAVLSAMLAIQNKSVSNVEGLIEDDVDRCIHNLTRLGSRGMEETDRMVLDIMTHKQ